MRFDLEQFLALTVALGTAGALGVAVYSSQDATAAPPPAPTANHTQDEPFPEAETEQIEIRLRSVVGLRDVPATVFVPLDARAVDASNLDLDLPARLLIHVNLPSVVVRAYRA